MNKEIVKIDLLIGFICGVIMFFSMTVYLVIWCLAAIAMCFLLLTRDASLASYANDKQGYFSGKIIFWRILIVNIGVIIGRYGLEIVS